LKYDPETHLFSVTKFALLLEEGSAALSNSPSWAVASKFDSNAALSPHLLVIERSMKCSPEEMEAEKKVKEEAEEEKAKEEKVEEEEVVVVVVVVEPGR